MGRTLQLLDSHRVRLVVAVAVLGSGVLALPLAGVSMSDIDWRMFADAYDTLLPGS